MVDWLSHSSMCCWPHYAGNFKNEHALFGSSVQNVKKTRKCCPHVISVPRKSQVQAESGAYGVGSAWAPIQNFPRAADGVSEREPLALARSPRFSHGCSRTGREGRGRVGEGEGESGEPGAREGERGRASWLYRSRQHAKLRRRNVYMCCTERRGE